MQGLQPFQCRGGGRSSSTAITKNGESLVVPSSQPGTTYIPQYKGNDYKTTDHHPSAPPKISGTTALRKNGGRRTGWNARSKRHFTKVKNLALKKLTGKEEG